MAGYFEAQMRKLLEELQIKGQRALDEADAEINEEANRIVMDKLLPLAEKDIENAFHQSVAQWYNAWGPGKVYSRTGSLHSIFEFSGLTGTEVGWQYVDDGTGGHPSILNKGKSFNVYQMAFVDGSHGNPLPWWSPTKTASPLSVFTEDAKLIGQDYSNRGWTLKKQYYDSVIGQRFAEKYR